MITKKKMCEGCQIEKYIWKNHEGKQYCVGCWSKIKPQTVKPRVTGESEPDNLVKNDGTPMVYKKTKKVKFPKIVSTKRKVEQKQYSIERYIFLTENEICQAGIKYVCTGASTDVHHMKGREGDLYLDKDNWLAVCRSCHQYIELHPKEAKERGFSKSRLDI